MANPEAGGAAESEVQERIRIALVDHDDDSMVFGVPHLIEMKFEDEPDIDPNNHGQIADALMSRAQSFLDNATRDLPAEVQRAHLATEGTIGAFHHVSVNMCRANLAHILHTSLAYHSELMHPIAAGEIAGMILDRALVHQDPADADLSPDDYPGIEYKEPLRAAELTMESVGKWAWDLIFGKPQTTETTHADIEEKAAPKKKTRSVALMATFTTGPNSSTWSSLSDCTFDAAVLIISPRNAFLLFMVDED
jgi:hypothetical protein